MSDLFLNIWSPSTVKDITAIDSVQHRFTKQLPGLNHISYPDRLKYLNIPSLKLRCLRTDLIWCHKIVFGLVDLNFDDFLMESMLCTRGQGYHLYKKINMFACQVIHFSEQVINVWSNMPTDTVDFTSLTSFKKSIMRVNITAHLKCFP